jgi:hypothetical protein
MLDCDGPGLPALRRISTKQAAKVQLQLMSIAARSAEYASRERAFNQGVNVFVANSLTIVSVFVTVPRLRSSAFPGMRVVVPWKWKGP